MYMSTLHFQQEHEMGIPINSFHTWDYEKARHCSCFSGRRGCFPLWTDMSFKGVKGAIARCELFIVSDDDDDDDDAGFHETDFLVWTAWVLLTHKK